MTHKLLRFGLPLATALLLAACGGGGGGNQGFPVSTAPATGGNTAPQGSTAPPVVDAFDSFVAYVKTLVASMSDTTEPVDVSAFDPPPTSETKDPVSTSTP